MSQGNQAVEPALEDAARWRFGECVLDERKMELSISGNKIELARKPLELLMYFVRNPGEVVTKDELFEAVWPGRIVSETSLTNAIGRLRSALHDEATQVLIKSVYGYGYRFMGEVSRETPGRGSLPAPLPMVDFKDGDSMPQRAGWILRKRLGAGGGGDAWLGVESATQDARVFKFARDRLALTALKREITLSRLMRESLGERADLVRVLDWNLDEAPYFIAVEYCSEGSLVDWSERQGGIGAVPLAQRLELLAQAADALAGAHQVGVLHKDLKPSNLLLHKDGEGRLQLKLADFGSARLVDQSRLTALNIAHLGFTQTLIEPSSGTPRYLAPELQSGSPSTTRSDVFALGVVLYQLVVGDLRRVLAPGWERDIDDPLLAEDIADAAAGDAQRRLADAAQLGLRLRTLPARRAARARQQQDLQAAEVTRQALARTRARRSLWMALAAALTLGLGLTFWQFLRARSTAREAEAVATFLIDDVLDAADPLTQTGSEQTVRQMLNDAGERLANSLQDQPGVRARIRLRLARALLHGGDFAGQTRQLEAALKDAEAAEGADGRLTLKVMTDLATAEQLTDHFDRARQLLDQVVARAGRVSASDPLIRDALNSRAYVEFLRGNYAESARLFEDYRQRLPASDDDPDVIQYNYDVPDVYIELGRLDEAESAIRKALAAKARVEDPRATYTRWMRVTLADVYAAQARWDEAETELQGDEDVFRSALGPEHVYTVGSLARHGRVKLLRGDAAGALPLIQRAYDIRLRLYGEKSSYFVASASDLGCALSLLDRASEAVPLLERALVNAESLSTPQHPKSLEVRARLAEALIKTGNPARARALMTEAAPWADAMLAPGSPRLKRFREVLAQTQGA